LGTSTDERWITVLILFKSRTIVKIYC